MKRSISLVAIFILILGLFAKQNMYSEEIPKLIKSVLDDKATYKVNGESKTNYPIKCTFDGDFSKHIDMIKNPETWKVQGRIHAYSVERVTTKSTDTRNCWLNGDWDSSDGLMVIYKNQTMLNVSTKEINERTPNWGFGKKDYLNLNFQLLADQRKFYAFDYEFKLNALERYISAGSGNIWIRSFSLSVWSKGIVASDDVVRNGTQTAVGFALNPFYFVNGHPYDSEFSLSYQIETNINEASNKMFDVINKHFSIGTRLEIPFTDIPAYKLHEATGYARVSLPLILNINYQTKGKNGSGNETLARFDFQATYELALSPYLIIKGEWHKSKFFNAPQDFDDSATYYSLSFAQDFDALKKVLGFLKLFESIEKFKGKHFIFLKITKGRRAPAFVDVDEVSIGFGTYF